MPPVDRVAGYRGSSRRKSPVPRRGSWFLAPRLTSLFSLFTFLFSLLALSCVSRPPPVLLSVPFSPQPPNHCGPNSLLLVARFHGLSPDPDALAAATFVPALDGTVPELLLDAAPAIGLSHATLVPLTPDNPTPVFAAIDSGLPPILLLTPPLGSDSTLGHFLVATGYNPATRALRVHTPTRPDRWLPPPAWLPRLSALLLFTP